VFDNIFINVNIIFSEIGNFNNIYDEVAEWLRRWTANPLCSARVGSNPIFVEIILSIMILYLITEIVSLQEWELIGVPAVRSEHWYDCCPHPYLVMP
jgi:hypothetical protein